MDKVTEIKVERYVEERKDFPLEAKLLLIKLLCETFAGAVLEDDDMYPPCKSSRSIERNS